MTSLFAGFGGWICGMFLGGANLRSLDDEEVVSSDVCGVDMLGTEVPCH